MQETHPRGASRALARTLVTVTMTVLGAGSARAQELFLESAPWMEVPSLGSGAPFAPLGALTEGTGGGLYCYAPPEVTDPAFGNGLAHPAQQLSCFLPTATPAPGETFPAIVWITAGASLEGTPMPGTPELGLLSEALDRGWAVVTVGSVGIDSDPVATQPPRCHPVGGGTPLASGCWDYNLWYPPDTVASSPWNDFSYFYGEKDVVWARQFLAQNAETLHLDNDRLVFGGTSTGAIYSAFLALESAPWQESTFGGQPLSAQVKTPTSIAGLILFEPVDWFEGVPPLGTSGPGLPLQGYHWPLASDPFRRTTWASQVTPLSVLRENSPSTWIRRSAQSVPTFVASGDGNPLSTGFGRDARLPQHALDYDRNPGSALPFDPAFTFGMASSGFSLVLHDGWHAWNLRRDLDLRDPVFHNRYSRLYMRKDLNWSFFPSALAGGATLGSPLASPYVVQLLHESYEAVCPDPGPSCISLYNLNLGPRVMDWLECVFADLPPGVACATADRNPLVMTSTDATIGSTWTLTVDVEAIASGYDHAAVFGYADVGGNTWVRVPVGGIGLTSLLCIDANFSGSFVSTDLFAKDPGTGLVSYPLPVPNDPALIGTRWTAQACVYDLCDAGDPRPFPSCMPVAPGSKLGTKAGNAIDVVVQAP